MNIFICFHVWTLYTVYTFLIKITLYFLITMHSYRIIFFFDFVLFSNNLYFEELMCILF